MKLYWLPNLITVLRMLGTGVLLFLVPESRTFYMVYAATGVTDVLDGTLARAMKATSPMGARLDSVADLLFYSVVLLRLLSVLWQKLPGWLWLWVGLILAMRLAAYLTAYRKTREFAASHSILNKATGAAVFLTPFLLQSTALLGWSVVVCVLATAASGQELYQYQTRKTTRRDSCGKETLQGQ